jgi:hypothetical protein
LILGRFYTVLKPQVRGTRRCLGRDGNEIAAMSVEPSV